VATNDLYPQVYTTPDPGHAVANTLAAVNPENALANNGLAATLSTLDNVVADEPHSSVLYENTGHPNQGTFYTGFTYKLDWSFLTNGATAHLYVYLHYPPASSVALVNTTTTTAYTAQTGSVSGTVLRPEDVYITAWIARDAGTYASAVASIYYFRLVGTLEDRVALQVL
jgi:hypothetical protein